MDYRYFSNIFDTSICLFEWIAMSFYNWSLLLAISVQERQREDIGTNGAPNPLLHQRWENSVLIFTYYTRPCSTCERTFWSDAVERKINKDNNAASWICMNLHGFAFIQFEVLNLAKIKCLVMGMHTCNIVMCAAYMNPRRCPVWQKKWSIFWVDPQDIDNWPRGILHGTWHVWRKQTECLAQ